MPLPPNIDYDLDKPLRDFWRQRAERHTEDYYRGRALCKMPEDLRTYQHIIESSQPDVIIELGAYGGGSAIWFADQLEILNPKPWRGSEPSVYTVDIANIGIPDHRVRFFRGDVTDQRLAAEIADLVSGRRVMVSEDSAHTHDSTLGALRNYAGLISKGCWFVVEDGIVDEDDVKPSHYRSGVQPAIEEFLASGQGKRFSRHFLHPYGVTTDFGGWLRADA